MITQTAATPSVLSLDAYRDTAIRIAFRLADPIGLTEVAVEPDPSDNAQLLQLIEAALLRLAAYRRDFIEAAAEDAIDAPLPLPRRGLDR